MSFYRVCLVALATAFTVGMTSVASAGCCGWGYSAPVTYGWGLGCGGCGAVAPYVTYAPPITYGWGTGCGACSVPTAAAVFARPVAPAPIVVNAPAPVVTTWAGGCCSRSLYVVNQGPTFTGPGLMVPYGTYTRAAAYAPAVDYPYVSGYRSWRYGYYHRSFYRPYYHRYGLARPHYHGPASHYYAPPSHYYFRHG